MFFSFSQETIKISSIRSSCVIANITPEQAKEKAIEEGKREALRKAGVAENIVVSDALYSTADAENMKQVFTSFSSIELSGQVLDYVIVNEERKTDRFGNFVVELLLDVEVIKYKNQPDPEFDFAIQGVEDFYKAGTKLEFSFLPYQNGYLRIFYFDDALDCDMIYPNAYEKSSVFTAGQKYNFPMNLSIDYTMEPKKERETNHLVFVFLKKDIPFSDNISYKNLLTYINGISPDQRVVKYFSFIIKGK